jgi:hypothetical protein
VVKTNSSSAFNLQAFAEVIKRRKWRNGHLIDLAHKVAAGGAVDREMDTDLSEKEWLEVKNAAWKEVSMRCL